MNTLLKIIPVVLYSLVGIISLLMAFKCLFNRTFLPFHQEAYGKHWEDIDKNLQEVILVLLRITGLGFLAIALLLLSFPLVNYLNPNPYLKFGPPLVALIFCSGLFLFNFRLYRNTKAKTPWKNALIAMATLVIAMVISLF